VIATDCLFHKLSSGGLVQLESCSVLGPSFLTKIKARNSMLLDIQGSNVTGVLEFSCYPESAPLSSKKMTIDDSTTDEPVFFARQRSLVARAVLAPGTSATIHSGASDGGEIGYFHSGRVGRPVLIEKNFTGARALSVPAGNRYPLQDLIFAGVVVVSAGNLELIRAAAKSLTVNTGFSTDVNGAAVPALDARDCLFDIVTVGNGLARFEYCTVMRAANCKQLQASDSIFAGAITDAAGAEPESGCVRYSRIPRGLTGTELNLHPGLADTNTREAPVFIKLDRCDAGVHTLLTAEFGQPGYGVLDPATAEAIRFGAEDGGEMGVGHHRYYSLKAEAMLDKMREFLPIGIDPVLIHDQRLLRVPPEIKNSTSGET
jgi:hypothetical protein